MIALKHKKDFLYLFVHKCLTSTNLNAMFESQEPKLNEKKSAQILIFLLFIK